MPRPNTLFSRILTALALCTLVTAGGCGSQNAIPSAVTVELPDGTEVRATLGSGVLTLADSTWDFFATSSSSQGAAFVRIEFGSEGELTRFDNNTIAPEIFGTTIKFDGATHPTTQQGLSYVAGTFGAETADSSGFTFEALLTVFAAGIKAANANATAMGTFDAEDPDRMTGTFSFTSRVTLASIPEGNVDMEFDFVAQRVTD